MVSRAVLSRFCSDFHNICEVNVVKAAMSNHQGCPFFGHGFDKAEGLFVYKNTIFQPQRPKKCDEYSPEKSSSQLQSALRLRRCHSKVQLIQPTHHQYLLSSVAERLQRDDLDPSRGRCRCPISNRRHLVQIPAKEKDINLELPRLQGKVHPMAPPPPKKAPKRARSGGSPKPPASRSVDTAIYESRSGPLG